MTVKNYLIATLTLLLAGAVLLIGFQLVQAATGPSQGNPITTRTPGNLVPFTFFAATTTTATSTNTTDGGGYFVINGAKKVVLYFTRGDTSGQGNTGTTTFKVQTTPDGTNWYDYNALFEVQATTTPTTVPTVSIVAATTTRMAIMDLRIFHAYAIRCIAVEAADGEHTCKATAEF